MIQSCDVTCSVCLPPIRMDEIIGEVVFVSVFLQSFIPSSRSILCFTLRFSSFVTVAFAAQEIADFQQRHYH